MLLVFKAVKKHYLFLKHCQISKTLKWKLFVTVFIQFVRKSFITTWKNFFLKFLPKYALYSMHVGYIGVICFFFFF